MKIISGEVIKKRGRLTEIKFQNGIVGHLPIDDNSSDDDIPPGEKITVVIGRKPRNDCPDKK